MRPAHAAVQSALRDGRLPPVRELKCVDCGRQAECYDHRDYLKPLDVEPLCKRCDLQRGKGANRGDEEVLSGGALKAERPEKSGE